MSETITLDMLQSAGIGALALLTGIFMTRKIKWLQRFCIPSPVSGGLVFSIITLLLYKFIHVEVTFDGTLKDVFMLAFFSSVGFQSNLNVIKQGGKTLVMMLILLVGIIATQNLIPIGICKLLDTNPLIGMAAGSISMAGGHGTAGGFSAVLESMGLQGAATISMAAATFGLIAGSVIGGPVAERLIRKHLSSERLEPKDFKVDPAMAGIESEEALPAGRAKRISSNEEEFQQFAWGTYSILIVMALGTLTSLLLGQTGITFPTYFGALLTAAVIRNIIELTPFRRILKIKKIVSVGNICLSLFLGMAMISLKLWELESLALPLITILFAQIVAIALLTYL